MSKRAASALEVLGLLYRTPEWWGANKEIMKLRDLCISILQEDLNRQERN